MIVLKSIEYDARIVGVHSTEQSAGIIVGAFDPNIIIYKYKGNWNYAVID